MENSVKRVKVLLVDDENISHEILRLFLKNSKYQLISAKSVNEAKEIISFQIPDIVITDAMMPGESGFSLISWMKLGAETSRIPVILWTILETPSGAVMDSTNSADILMSKPFYDSNISEKLKEAEELIISRNAAKPAVDDDSPFVNSHGD